MRFKFKVFTSFILTLSFLSGVLSGLALYLSPKGRIANWIEWTWLGMTKEEWAEFHTIIVTLFLIAAIFHLFYFNWKVFWAYLVKKSSKRKSYLPELVSSIIVFILIVIGIFAEIPPVISIARLGENIKDTYETEQNNPPVAHAEDMMLYEFAAQVANLEYRQLANKLNRGGYQISDSTQTLGELASANGVSPSDLFNLLNIDGTSSDHSSAPAGLGQRKLDQLCGEIPIDIETAIQKLEAAGIHGVQRDGKIKDIANNSGRMPVDIYNIIVAE